MLQRRTEYPLNNTPNYPDKEENGVSAQDILNDGYRVGFLASSDNHNGAPGLSAKYSRFTNIPYSGYFAAVFAPELSRHAIFDALWHRKCYATTGVRIYLEFRINRLTYGLGNQGRAGQISLFWEIRVAAPARISKIELISQEYSETIWSFDGRDFLELNGKKVFKKNSWLYARVTLENRHMAWSSPIWIDAIDS